MATLKCSMGECKRPARWQIGMMLHAVSMPAEQRTDKNAAKGLTSLVVCDECRASVKPKDLLSPEGRARIATGFFRAGRAMPDFDNVRIEFEEIIDQPIDVTTMPNGESLFEA
jgi:hypothetical protein